MYSAADYVEMLIIIFGECWRNAKEAARVSSDRFPDRPSPDYKTILRVLARAQETGTFANEEAILNIVEEAAQEIFPADQYIVKIVKNKESVFNRSSVRKVFKHGTVSFT
jgi:hypothetical protein